MPVDFAQIQTFLRGTARQRGMTLRSAGEEATARLTLADQFLTAGWREELLLAGLCYGVTVGGISAGADVSLIQGGGAGTTIDSDQPELVVGVPTGYYLVPLRCQVAGQLDLDADAEVGNILLFADTSACVAATGITGTAETPVPLLGGGPESIARCWSALTGDMTDPVLSHLLAYETVSAREFVSNGTATNLTNGVVTRLALDYQPKSPPIFKGPCQIVLCWGGTAAVNGLATFEWAELPAGRVQ